MSDTKYPPWADMIKPLRIEAVTELLQAGLSYTEIAIRVKAFDKNGEPSRSAISGFIHLNGLKELEGVPKTKPGPRPGTTISRVSKPPEKPAAPPKVSEPHVSHPTSDMQPKMIHAKANVYARVVPEEDRLAREAFAKQQLAEIEEKLDAEEKPESKAEGDGFCVSWIFDPRLQAETYCGRPTPHGAKICDRCAKTGADTRMKIAR